MFDWLCYNWSVPVNSFYKEHLISPQFCSSKNDEAKFRIKICPSGAKKRNYFSLFVICDSKETSFKAKICATLLNRNQRNHYGLAANHTFCSGSAPFGWQNFIKIEDLMNREEGFIMNECIQIWCVIGVTLLPQPRLVYVQNEEEVPMDCEDYECYFEYGNNKLKIDSNVIAQRSEIVKKELFDNNNNNAFHQMVVKILPSVSLMTFQKLINYFKGDGNLDGYEREALIIADTLQMLDLKEFCETKLAKMVVYENLKKFTNLAIKYNAALILEKCLVLRNRRDSKCHFVI